MEFEYNKGDIKSLLKKASMENVEDVAFFVTNKIEKKAEKKEPVIYYNERSHGIFENKVKDETLRKKFEEIRSIIKDS